MNHLFFIVGGVQPEPPQYSEQRNIYPFEIRYPYLKPCNCSFFCPTWRILVDTDHSRQQWAVAVAVVSGMFFCFMTLQGAVAAHTGCSTCVLVNL